MMPSWGEVIHHRVEQLRSSGVNMAFAGLMKKVIEPKSATDLLAVIVCQGLYSRFAHIFEPAGATRIVSEGIDHTSRLLSR